MRKVVFIIGVLIHILVSAQKISFNFEGTNLSSWEESDSGHWHIDSIDPIHGFGSLRHNYDATGTSHDMLSYKHKPLHLDSVLTEWQFSVRYNYRPSSSNNWAFWLSSNKSSGEMYPSGSGEGYIVGVNYTGYDDFIKLWRQEDGNITSVCTSSFNWDNNIPNGKTVSFKISRTTEKEWVVMIDTSGMEYFAIGSGYDSSFSKSDYIGIYYEYSSTQDRKLWIDNILVKGAFIEDLESPKVKCFSVLERDIVQINFNEEVDTTGEMLFVLDRKNYPISIEWINSSEVYLKYSKNFEPDNLIELYNLTDLKGNSSQIERFQFTYYTPKRHDIIISEIMADPTPQIELPECEYVELYNRSSQPINLNGWSFVSGERTPVRFGKEIIDPNSFVLIVDDGFISEFPDSIQVATIKSFPALPNSGEHLMLYDNYGELIHQITYTNNSYIDDTKEEGGYSLEIIDTDYPCVVTNNWVASNSKTGGTPGYTNSESGALKDYPISIFTELSEIRAGGCKLTFSEPLDSSSAFKVSNYNFSNSDNSVDLAIPTSPEFKEVVLEFSKSIIEGKLYTLEIESSLYDCSGILVYSEPIVFGLPQGADSMDLIINEILFESNYEVPEFIELYNNSEKVIDLNGISLVSFDEYTDTVKSTKSIVDYSFQIFPKSFVVLTEDKALLVSMYSNVIRNKIIQISSWLNLNNEGGKIGLLNKKGSIIDLAVFSSEMHFSLIENTSGVSLERISSIAPGTNTNNWHSAATSVNYATPGEENSQSYIAAEETSLVTLSPMEFSPDNDGVNDFLTINYSFPQTGYVANVRIYSQRGDLIRYLVNNELCEIKGNYVWDGLGENGERTAMGYYIIYFEAWHPDGNVIQEKLVCLLLPENK